MSYTLKNLREVEDSAAKFGYSEMQEARFANADLGVAATGVSYIAVKPGKRQPFGLRHDEAEEVYVVLSGCGRLRLDDEVVEIGPLDAIRIAPAVARRMEAGPEGLEVLAFGPKHERDGELLHDFWAD